MGCLDLINPFGIQERDNIYVLCTVEMYELEACTYSNTCAGSTNGWTNARDV